MKDIIIVVIVVSFKTRRASWVVANYPFTAANVVLNVSSGLFVCCHGVTVCCCHNCKTTAAGAVTKSATK